MLIFMEEIIAQKLEKEPVQMYGKKFRISASQRATYIIIVG
jgi:hypothetical protein